MTIAVILGITWALIYAFKKLGMEQLHNGLLAGFLGSILGNAIFYFVGESVVNIVLSLVGFTAISVLSGFLMSRKIYGMPGLFEDAQ